VGELRVVLEIFVLALASAVWPTLIAIVLVALASPRPVRLLAFFLAGGLLATTTLGLAVVFSLEASNLLTGSRPSAPPAIDLMVGLLLLLVAGVASRGRREKPRSESEGSEQHLPWTERTLARGSGHIAFLVGVVLNLVPGLFAVVGYKDIAQLDVSALAAIALVLAFNVIMFSLVELPLIGYFVAPSWTAERVRGLNKWLRDYGRQLIVLVAAVGGAYLVVRGFVGLVD
jgi:hypothetical protein